MNKIVVTSLATLMAFSLNAEDNLSISGFGSIGIGKATTAIDYAGYNDKQLEWENETLAGLQLEAQINHHAKFVAQVVANSRYDFEPKVEMAYLSYEFEHATARAGKLRLPLFLYSDYLDLGFAYPMIRPSQETYGNIILRGYTGAELLIPLEFDNSSLLLQPVVGTANIDEDDTRIGAVKLDNMMGLSTSWNIQDLTLRGSYFQAEANPECRLTTIDLTKTECLYAQAVDIHGQDGQFISLGMQYDNGSLITTIEATDTKVDSKYPDTQTLSALLGYRTGQFTTYFTTNWVETSDNEERPLVNPQNKIASLLNRVMNYERLSYSIGSRWDLSTNMALKLDLTWVDYKDTSGGSVANVERSTGRFIEDDNLVYSARLDFLF